MIALQQLPISVRFANQFIRYVRLASDTESSLMFSTKRNLLTVTITAVIVLQKTVIRENNFIKVCSDTYFSISEMLFLLIFIITNVHSQTAQYDNTVQSSLADSPLSITEPCFI